MEKTCTFTVGLIVVLFLFACQKEKSYTTNSHQTDVYVIGWESDGTHSDAKYWKNGSSVYLTDRSNYSQGYAVAVSGSDVYAAGFEDKGAIISDYLSTYWKNGKSVHLSNGFHNAYAKAIAVSGNDICVAGEEINYEVSIGGGSGPTYYAIYWKNGHRVNLTDGSTPASASSIVIAGSDVYVAGSEGNVAKYWKNGRPVIVGSLGSHAYSIAVSGNDVYVAGSEWNGNYYNGKYIAKYWKNGVSVNLTDGSKSSAASSIAVSGNDLYVAGSEEGVAKYWKNGVAVDLPSGSDATCIAVSGSDVYVSGSGWKGMHRVARYWKNGNPADLSDGLKDEYGASILLVER